MTNRRAKPGTLNRSAAPTAARPEEIDPALPAWITPELIAETFRVWQPHYDNPLTHQDAIALIQNVCGLLDVLSHDKMSK